MSQVSIQYGLSCCLLVLGSASAQAQSVTTLELDIEKTHDLTAVEMADGSIELATQGSDPFVLLKPFDSKEVEDSQSILAFEVFAPQGMHGLEVYFGPPITSSRHFAAGELERSESWMPFSVDLKSLSENRWTREFNLLRLDFGHSAGVKLALRNVQLRPPNAQEQQTLVERQTERREKLARQAKIDDFYSTKFPAAIESVSVSSERALISGSIPEELASSEVHLLEIRPEISVADHARWDNGACVLEMAPGVRSEGALADSGRFEKSLPRKFGAVDRSISRWAIGKQDEQGGWRLLSHWKYATDLSQATGRPLPGTLSTGNQGSGVERPGVEGLGVKGQSIKGLGGIDPHFPLEELVELGIHHITANLTLAHLMDSQPHGDWIPFEHAGKQWYVHPARLAAYDKLVRFATDHDIVVSGVLLIGFAESDFGRTVRHPEANRGGHYAMPNFTTSAGVEAYEAVLEFLSQRYGLADSGHGRIANWIVHNEVGYGFEWTNMGTQPAMLYMDHYLRSMRLVHNVMRRRDPHARVFISLTHHWNTPGSTNWRSYSNLELLERLIESSRIEGDFAWGVAYHPYPQNLRNPDAWDDRMVTDEFDTPLITPRNIAVLDRWMHLPKARDQDGNVRGLLLSEQGFNSPDYSQESQERQAAGLVYMWRQMRGLESIEAFHHHRWVDHPREGGLLLGLRKLPEGDALYGPKKLSWEVYRALDTPAEADAIRFADDVIKRQ